MIPIRDREGNLFVELSNVRVLWIMDDELATNTIGVLGVAV